MNQASQSDNGSAPDAPSGLLPADLLRGAWRRKSRVLMGLLLGLLAGALCWTLWTPTYESQMQLLVVKKKVPEAQRSDVSPQIPEFEDYLSAQQALLSSPLIVRRAVEEARLHRLDSLEGEADPVAAIIKNLRVTRDSEARSGHALLSLGYRSTVPEDCKAVLEAIVAGYKGYLAETQSGAAGEIGKIFTQWRDEVQKGIGEKREVYQRLRAATPATEWTGKDGVNLSESRLGQLESERLRLTMRRTELQGRLAALTKARQQGATHEELVQMITHWSQAWQNPAEKEATVVQKIDTRLHEQLLALRLQEQSLPASYGPGHPQARAIHEQIQLAEQMLRREASREDPGEAQSAPEPESGLNPGPVLRPADIVNGYMTALQEDLESATQLQEKLSGLAQKEQAQARRINDLNEDMEALRSEIASAEQLQQQIVQQLQGLTVFHDSDLYHAEVISPASAGLLVAPVPWLVFPVAALFGLFLGGGLAWSAEVNDKSFRNPGEIRSRLGLPVIGHTEYAWMPARSKRKAGRNGREPASTLCTYFVPDSTESEAYRRIRSMVCHTNGRPKSVIQITSPNRGDGRSTVSANLAVSLAQMGRRVVLVDADFRAPSLHRLFSVPRDKGVASVLAGQSNLADAIRSTSVENLSVLPCEKSSAGATERLSLDSFQRLVCELRKRFDFVLIDTPPVLGTSDASVVAHHADVVLLALRNTRDVRPLAEQAVQTLTDQEAHLLGVVVNNPLRNRSRNRGYEDLRLQA